MNIMTKKGIEIREELEKTFPKDGRVVIDCAACNATVISYIPKSILILESYYGMSYKDRINYIMNNFDITNENSSYFINYILTVSNIPFDWINDEFNIDIFDVIENKHYTGIIKNNSNESWEEQLAYEIACMLLEIVKNNNKDKRRR